MNREELLKIVKPILFNTEMVQAILDNRKSVTRRIIKPQIISKMFTGVCTESTMHNDKMVGCYLFGNDYGDVEEYRKPPYNVGDYLYVRETWTQLCRVDENGYTHFDDVMTYYYADGEPDINLYDADGFLLEDQTIKWKPSIHMPKLIARIFLKVTDVRVERLQDINHMMQF